MARVDYLSSEERQLFIIAQERQLISASEPVQEIKRQLIKRGRGRPIKHNYEQIMALWFRYRWESYKPIRISEFCKSIGLSQRTFRHIQRQCHDDI